MSIFCNTIASINCRLYSTWITSYLPMLTMLRNMSKIEERTSVVENHGRLSIVYLQVFLYYHVNMITVDIFSN